MSHFTTDIKCFLLFHWAWQKGLVDTLEEFSTKGQLQNSHRDVNKAQHSSRVDQTGITMHVVRWVLEILRGHFVKYVSV